MQIKYLGTGAAEGIPAIFCDCEICNQAKRLGGKNIRTRSQAIIDDKLLIDFPPDTYAHMLAYDINLSKIKSCLITHSHEDHLFTSDIMYRRDGFSHLDSYFKLCFYADKSSFDIIQNTITGFDLGKEIEAVLVKPHEEFCVEEYKVVAVRATHSPKTDPLLYIISHMDKCILYAHDTSDLAQEEWDFLRKTGRRFDLISLDCTEGNPRMSYVGHMNLQRCIDIRNKFVEIGASDDNTKYVLNHFSHNGKVIHSTFSEIAKKEGFITAYDGMCIDV